MMHLAVFRTRRYDRPGMTVEFIINDQQGFHFLYYLEKVVGKENFDKFIPHYFTMWQKKSLDSYEFKSTFLDFFASDETASKALAEVDWESWFYKPGLPPKPKFDTSMVDKCYALADKWANEKVCHSTVNVHLFTSCLISDCRDSGFQPLPLRYPRLDRQPNRRLPREGSTLLHLAFSIPIASHGQSLQPSSHAQRRA